MTRLKRPQFVELQLNIIIALRDKYKFLKRPQITCEREI